MVPVKRIFLILVRQIETCKLYLFSAYVYISFFSFFLRNHLGNCAVSFDSNVVLAMNSSISTFVWVIFVIYLWRMRLSVWLWMNLHITECK